MKKRFTLFFAFCLSLNVAFSQMAPDFTFTDINGDEHTLSESLAEGKVIIIDFFFVDCPPCNQWNPEIEQLIEDYGSTNVEVWAFSDRDSDAYIQSSVFNPSHSNHFIGGPDSGADAVIDLYAGDPNFYFSGFPTYSVICNDGSITWDLWPLTAGIDEIRSQLTEDCGVMESTATSVSNIDELSGVSIFPNPVSEKFTLEFDLAQSVEMTIDIYNTLGQIVKSIPSTNYDAGAQNMQIDVTNLTEGLYLVNMKSEQGTQTLELSVMK